MIISALCFVAGILCVQQFSELPGLYWLLMITMAGLVLACLRHWRTVFFIIGLLWAVLFAMQRLDDRLPTTLESIEIPVTGVITDLPDLTKQRSTFDFKITQSPFKLPHKIRLSWYYPDQTIKSGQKWSFVVKLKRPHGSLNPGGFDYEKYLFSQGVGATGYIRTQTKPLLLGRVSGWFSIAVWRQTIADDLTQLLQGNSSLGLIKALTIGDGSDISKTKWDIFRKTGTTHLVVISGSHVGLLAGLAYLWVLKLWARFGYLKWAPQTIAAISAIIVATLYSGLAGFSVPTQRALVMLSVWMLSVILQRNTKPYNTLALSLFAVLAYDPLAVLSVGFWLSYLAVGLIVYVISGRLGKHNTVIEMLKINAATSLGLSPLLLIYFQQISVISPIANFIAVPLISFLSVPLALLGVATMALSPWLAMQLFQITDGSLQILMVFLNTCAQLPMALYTHAQPPFWSLLFTVPAVLILLAPVGMPYRYLSVLLFLPMFASTADKPAAGSIKLTVLDVGQALSIVIQTQQHSLIFDAGSKYSEDSDAGISTLLPFLRYEGINTVDTLMISHADSDHIGGAASLIKGIPVKAVLTTAMRQLQDYQPIKCEAGQTWEWDAVTFRVLAPITELSSENDNACVLQIKTLTTSYLLPSDIEAEAETALMTNYGQALKSDVLIAPHHGSKTSSTPAYLTVVYPKVILISAGYLSKFGHPHPDVTRRYQQQGIEWFNTAEQGALTITEPNDHWQIDAMRTTEGKYWNNK